MEPKSSWCPRTDPSWIDDDVLPCGAGHLAFAGGEDVLMPLRDCRCRRMRRTSFFGQCVTESTPRTPTGRMVASFLASFAELELEPGRQLRRSATPGVSGTGKTQRTTQRARCVKGGARRGEGMRAVSQLPRSRPHLTSAVPRCPGCRRKTTGSDFRFSSARGETPVGQPSTGGGHRPTAAASSRRAALPRSL
jgi:hypothetical protein